ncbi:MAG: proteasome assembly chaperone family protein [Thermoplasmatota archaeon]
MRDQKMTSPCYEINEEDEIPEVDTLLAGFPGIGLVGGIASEQLINTLDLEQVASLDCDEFPPTAVVFDGIPRRPVRFFYGEGFLLVKSDMVIPPELTNSLAEKIVEWAQEKGVNEIFIMDGVQKRDESEENKIWGVLSGHTYEGEAEEIDLDIIERGAITGISSSLILTAHEKDLKAIGMYIESNPKLPDPRAAVSLLQKFAGIKDIEIETESLIERAEELEEMYNQMVSQAKQAQKKMDRSSATPPLYG